MAASTGCHIVAGYDGLTLREHPEPLWSTSVNGDGPQSVRALAAVPSLIYALAQYNGQLSWEDSQLASSSVEQAALLQFNAEGALNWTRPFVSNSSVFGRSMVASDERVIVAGIFGDSVDIAGTMLTSPDGEGIYLTEVSSAGDVLTARSYGGSGFSAPRTKVSIALDQQGSVLIGGTYLGELDFGCGPLVAQGPVDAYVAKITDGQCDWSRSLGDSKLQQLESIAVELGGDVVIAGNFAGVLDFGDVALQSGGGIDAYVAKLAPDGTHRWSHRYGDSGGAVSSVRATVHRFGNVTLAGYFEGTVDFGNGPVTARQGHDLFVVKFNPNGELLWSRHFPTLRDPCGLDDCELDRMDLATDIDGNLVLTGHFRDEVDFGGTVLRSIGATDLFVAKLDVSGNLLWSGRFGNVAAQCEPPDCVALTTIDSARNIILGGGYLGRMDFGQATLLSETDGGGFLAKLAP